MNDNPIVITMVCNKGGVGRSTSSINVGWKLAEMGYKTLIVDLDAQCNTSMTLSVDYVNDIAKTNKSLTFCIADDNSCFFDCKVDTRHQNLDLLGATILLDETEENMKQKAVPTHIISSKIDEKSKNYYDFILFDTPPSKHSKLLHNALVVSDYYWYVVGAEDIWALDARVVVDKVVDSIRRLNKKLKPLPVLITKYRSNVLQCKIMKKTCEEQFSNLSGVFDSTIRFTTQITRSESKRMSIFEYDKSQNVASDYLNLTKEMIAFINKDRNLKNE